MPVDPLADVATASDLHTHRAGGVRRAPFDPFHVVDPAQEGAHVCQARVRECEADHRRCAVIPAQLLCQAVGDDPACVDDHHTVAGRLGLAEDVGGKDHGLFAADLADDRADLDDLVGVQPRGGLIQDKDLRVTDHRMRQTGPLAIATRELADGPMHHVLEAAEPREPGDPLLRLPVWQITYRSYESEMVVDEHVPVEGCHLRKVADASLDLHRMLPDVQAFDQHGSTARRQVPGEDAHGSRLAGAVWAEETEDLSPGHISTDAIDRARGAEVLGEIPDPDDELVGHPGSPGDYEITATS